MKKWIALMALTTAASSASATLLYDPFNYAFSTSPQSVLLNAVAPNGQTWAEAGPTTGGRVQIASGSLAQGTTASASYDGLAAPQGNSINNLNVTQGLRVALGNNQVINSGTAYYSLGLNVNSLGALTTAGVFLCGFNNVAGSQAGAVSTVGTRLYMRVDADGTDYDIGVAKDLGPNADTMWFPTPLNLNTTYFVVGGYTVVGTTEGSDDISDMWVNPSPSTFGQSTAPAPDMDVNPQTLFPNDPTDQVAQLGKDVGVGTVGDPTSTEDVATFALRTATGLPQMSVDELRIDTTWAGVTAVEWESSSNANWSGNTNWSNQAAFPNAIGADVTFGTNSSVQTVTLDQPATVGTIRFNGTASYTIAGPATLTLQEAADTGISNPAQIIVSAGSHTISAPVQINKNLALNIASGSSIALSGGVTAASGISITLGGSQVSGGNAVIKPASATSLQGLGGLTIAAGNLQFSPAHSAILTTAFSLASGSTLDLTNNDLIVDYAGTDTTTGPAVVAAVQAARDNGVWDMPGITTSLAPFGSGKTLAVVDNETLATPLTTVDGLTIDSSTVVAKYTWYGDLNLDGVVNNTDIGMMGTLNSTTSTPNWVSGDLNGDGLINQDDWSLLDLGVAESGGANISSVPEPGIGLLAAGLGLLSVRRRRK